MRVLRLTRHLFAALFLVSTLLFARHAESQSSVPAAAAKDTGCCGPVTPAGQRLLQVLDGMDVEHLWQPWMRVKWDTGVAIGPSDLSGTNSHTHCSAFAAAVGARLDVYMLRPPEHGQTLLASAQGQWFLTDAARQQGWRPVGTAAEAQRLANEGQLVVLDYINPDPKRSGHIALVRPASKTAEALAFDGPETIQAGGTNFAEGTAKKSFRMHEGAWPNEVKIYAHATKFSSEAR